MQTISQTTNSRTGLLAPVCACAALLFLLIHLDPIGQVTTATWAADHPTEFPGRR